MKKRKIALLLALTLIVGLLSMACSVFNSGATEDSISSPGQIYLLGEYEHSNPDMQDQIYAWWDYFYHEKGMRHYFLEDSYYGAQLLNLWMKADNDDILNEMYDDIVNTQAHSPVMIEFFKKIKENCPETIFHGTDVGHQYDSTGERYLKYLEDNGMKDSEEYKLTLEIMEQGKTFYSIEDDRDSWAYREDKMVENFLRELKTVGENESIFGSYGGAHTEMFGACWYDYWGTDNAAPSFDCMTLRLRSYLYERLNIIQLYDFHEFLPPKVAESK